MNDKGFPKFQYSLFLDDKRDEQIVIRCDTWEEFIDAKKDIDKIVVKRKSEPVTNQNHSELQEDLGECSKCGAPNKLSKAGKPYCSKLCWK